MIKLNVRVDIQGLRQQFKGFEKEVNKAAAVSLNRVATTVRKEANDGIRERLNLKSSVVRANLKIVRPYGAARLIRDIVASGRPIPLRDYSARETRKGVTFAVARKGGRKRYIRQGQAGFILKTKGGHVFVRKGPDPKGPGTVGIKKVYGPSIPQMFVSKVVRDRLLRVANERWSIEITREINFRSKAGRLG
jgi:hypothetical protein